MRSVLYLSHAKPDVYDIIREAMPAGYELLTLEQDSDDERRSKIRDVEVAIVAAYPLRKAVIDAARALRLVHHQGVGYQDTVDYAVLAERGIGLALTPAGTTEVVAEHTILLLLAILKRLPFADRELRQGRWHINTLRPVSRELRGMTIGYIGMGRIGQAVASRLAAFGTSGLYFDPKVRLGADRETSLNLRAASLDDLLAQSDAVTLHLPASAETKHLIGPVALARMKRGAYLVNTSRGSLVDETALLAALKEGRLAGAGLDVFETEPPGANPLFALENVVVTPHISAGTRDALAEKMRSVFSNIERFYRGQPLENQVLPPKLGVAAE